MDIAISNSAGRADFFDASALVKIYVAEDGHEKVRTHFHNSPTKYTTPFCFYETLSVLKGKWGRKELDRNQYLDAAFRLSAWYAASSSQIIDLNFTNPDLLQSARSLVEVHNIDLSDAFQILSVKHGYFSRLINNSRTLLVTADKGLVSAARSQGLKVWSVLEEAVSK
jgi:predicted nucleic acid-binding protein